MIAKHDRKIEICVKGGFSERKGLKKLSNVIQIDSLNTRTRNKIYTATENLLTKSSCENEIIEYIYTEIFSLTRNDIPIKSAEFSLLSNYYNQVYQEIQEILAVKEYFEIFDFIEAIIKLKRNKKYNGIDEYIREITRIFIDENVNHRIIDGVITDIVNDEEIKAVEETLDTPYIEISKHFSKAIEHLYSNKDYANSIKESITSVELMCQIINGGKDSLGKTLKNLKVNIHPALSKGFESIYGYTSDASGIRHANGLGEKDATFLEAKYMLISCSAFINYLKEIYEEK